MRSMVALKNERACSKVSKFTESGEGGGGGVSFREGRGREALNKTFLQ